MSRAQLVSAALSEALGEPLEVTLRGAGGGCINSAAIAEAGGRTWFLKWNERPLPRQFEAEARGLEAMRAAGANSFQVMLYAIMPQVLPQVIGVVIFEWEINIRRSAVLGLVGAGGLGLVFFRQLNTFNFHGVTAVILAILAIIFLGEAISHAVRRRMI